MDKTYEQSLARLEEIVAKLEEGGLSLDETLTLFAEGTQIIGACSKTLDEAEQKIYKMTEDGALHEQ